MMTNQWIGWIFRHPWKTVKYPALYFPRVRWFSIVESFFLHSGKALLILSWFCVRVCPSIWLCSFAPTDCILTEINNIYNTNQKKLHLDDTWAPYFRTAPFWSQERLRGLCPRQGRVGPGPCLVQVGSEALVAWFSLCRWGGWCLRHGGFRSHRVPQIILKIDHFCIETCGDWGITPCFESPHIANGFVQNDPKLCFVQRNNGEGMFWLVKRWAYPGYPQTS